MNYFLPHQLQENVLNLEYSVWTKLSRLFAPLTCYNPRQKQLGRLKITALILTTFQKISSIGMYYVFMPPPHPPPSHIDVEVLLNIMIDNMM